MYTKQALRGLGIAGAGITSEQAKQLDEIGYSFVENALSDAQLASMRSEFERIHALENDLGGYEVHVEPGARRISNIFTRPTPTTVA